MNQESQQMAGRPGAAQVPWWVQAKPGGGTRGAKPRKLLGFQHLNELLVHVFLPIFASIFTCIFLCVKETTTLTQQKITKKFKYSTERDIRYHD